MRRQRCVQSAPRARELEEQNYKKNSNGVDTRQAGGNAPITWRDVGFPTRKWRLCVCVCGGGGSTLILSNCLVQMWNILLFWRGGAISVQLSTLEVACPPVGRVRHTFRKSRTQSKKSFKPLQSACERQVFRPSPNPRTWRSWTKNRRGGSISLRQRPRWPLQIGTGSLPHSQTHTTDRRLWCARPAIAGLSKRFCDSRCVSMFWFWSAKKKTWPRTTRQNSKGDNRYEYTEK